MADCFENSSTKVVRSDIAKLVINDRTGILALVLVDGKKQVSHQYKTTFITQSSK